MSGESEIIFSVEGRVGRVHLNCPDRLNALSADMFVAFRRQLLDWADDGHVAAVVVTAEGGRAFCAGGNLRQLYHQDDRTSWGREFYWNGYRLFAAVNAFPKPYVALADGINMGAGAGLSVNGSHCVVTERTVFAMPETGIGLFPDVGAAHFLNRCPGRTGMYLALSGARIGAGDMVDLGLATAMVPADRMDALVDALVDALTGLDFDGSMPAATAIDTAIGAFAVPPPPPQLTMHRPVIDRAFAAVSVSGVISALCVEDGYWAIETADVLEEKSPTSLEIAHRLMGTGPGMPFKELMRTEYRLASSLVAGHDFFEGIRAAVIDKDRNPKWRPATLDEVRPDDIDACFGEPARGDLHFE